MARAAKKETPLTTEEKLAKALVPREEQPYPVPENWCWVKLKHVTKNISDGSHNPPPDSGKGIPLLSAQNIHDNMIDINSTKRWITEEDYKKENTRTNIEPGDVLLTIVATIGRSAIVGNELFALQRSVAVIKPTGVLPSYMMYYFDSPYNQSFMEENAKGTAQKGFYLKSLEQLFFPLPPLPEQQRIVTLIESLFADLDAAKEKLQAVLDGFAERRAALLHQAFTGELTREWREENGVGLESWVRKKIEDFAFTTKLAGFEYTKNIAPNIAKEGIPLFKGKNVQQGQLVLEFESYIPKAVSDELPRSKLSRKCLLTPYVGTIGNVAIFDGSFEAHLGSNVGKIEIQEDTFEEFLLYYLRSDLGYRELTKEKKATAQESISIQAIRNVFVPIPTLPEQKEIVRILDDIFTKESHSRAAVEAALTEIDTIKKTILATAFRGAFETNDSSDERVEELLRRVL